MNIQGIIWERLISGIGETGLYDQCETKRAQQAESLYTEMYKKFMNTLTGEQKDAFYAIVSIADTVRWGQQEVGVAIGLHIAKELQDFLNNPSEAFHEASENHVPLYEAEQSDIQALNRYFESIKKQQ